MPHSTPSPPPPRWLFGPLLLAFGLLLGWLSMARPFLLLVAAGVTLTATLLSLLLNSDTPRRRQLPALASPALLALPWLLTALAVPPLTVAIVMAGLPAAAGLLCLASGPLHHRIAAAWIAAGEPVGWAISFLVLTLTYFLVFTPIGLALRLTGRDPMARRFDHAAASYWAPHRGHTDPRRYFRQF